MRGVFGWPASRRKQIWREEIIQRGWSPKLPSPSWGIPAENAGQVEQRGRCVSSNLLADKKGRRVVFNWVGHPYLPLIRLCTVRQCHQVASASESFRNLTAAVYVLKSDTYGRRTSSARRGGRRRGGITAKGRRLCFGTDSWRG